VKEERIPQYPSLAWVRGLHKRKATRDPKPPHPKVEVTGDKVCSECKESLKTLEWRGGSQDYILVCDNFRCIRFRQPQGRRK